MNYIITYTGKKFDFEELETNLIDIRDIAHALSQICRFTGHCPFNYSVAQHCCLVSDFLLTSSLESRYVACLGLLHDAAEAYLGDVSTPLKRVINNYKDLENSILSLIFDKFLSRSPEQIEIALVTDVDKLFLMAESMQFFQMNFTDIPDCRLSVGDVPMILPWSTQQAEVQFLARFDRLKLR